METGSSRHKVRRTLARALAIAATLALAAPPAGAQDVEWRSYGSDAAGTKYSPLDQINAETIGDLEIVWRQSVLPDAVRQGSDLTPPVASQNTPLMADGRLYISTALGTVAALDATTGEVLWFDTPPDRDGEPFQRVRQTARGRLLGRPAERRRAGPGRGRRVPRGPGCRNRRALSRLRGRRGGRSPVGIRPSGGDVQLGLAAARRR